MTNLLLIFICLGAGALLAHLRVLPRSSCASINTWLIYVALPALSLRYVPAIVWERALLLPVLAPLVIWLGAWFFVRVYGGRRQLTDGTKAALLIGAGLSNTSFLGFALISVYYGQDKIKHAIILDQFTFVLFAVCAMLVCLKHTPLGAGKEAKPHPLFILKKILSFPPLLGCLAGLVVPRFFDITPLSPLLETLTTTVSPLALFSIGMQLDLSGAKELMPLIRAGLFYKLLIAPFLVLLLALAMGTGGDLARISVFESAMSPHITAALMAAHYQLHPKLSNLLACVGVIAALGSSLFWWAILRTVL